MNFIQVNNQKILYELVSYYNIDLSKQEILINFQFVDENEAKEKYFSVLKLAIDTNIQFNYLNSIIHIYLKECYLDSNKIIMKGQLI